MSSKHVDYDNLERPTDFEVSSRFYTICGAMALIGALAFVAGLVLLDNPHRAWSAYLIGYWLTLGFGLAGPFILATQYVSTGTWGVSVRRVFEAFGAFLAPAVLLGVVLLLGAEHALPWLGLEDLDVTAHSLHIIGLKEGFLNMTGLTITTVVAPVTLLGVFYWIRSNSLKQDESGDPELTDTNKTLSVIFLLLFGVGFSLLSWYWMMSLEPLWYATMWQVYNFAALFQSGLALATIVVILLKRQGVFGDFVGEYQIHSLGQLVFAFTVFYAYIAFSQFMLCWYANIPEESLFYIRRLGGVGVNTADAGASLAGDAGGYLWFAWLWILKFIAPFLILLPQNIKKNKWNILYYVCWVLVAVQAYEVWYWVAFSPKNPDPLVEPTIYLPWLEFLVTLGFVGLFMMVVARSLASSNIVPTKDPRLHESVEPNLGHHGGGDEDETH